MIKRAAMLLCACVSINAQAEEEQPWDWLLEPQPLPSSLSLFVGGGEDDYRDLFVSADLDTFKRFRLLANYSESIQDNDDTDDLQTRGYALGISSDPLNDFVIQLQGEYWGQENTLETYRAEIELRYQAIYWSTYLSLQQRDITVLSDTLIQREFDVTDQSAGLAFNIYWPENWRFETAYFYHEYDNEKLSALDRPFIQQFFSSITLSLAYGLEKERLNYGIGYTWNDTAFGVSRTHSRSVVDDSISYASEIYASHYWQSWQGHLRFGRQTYDDSDDSSRFVNLGVSYLF